MRAAIVCVRGWGSIVRRFTMPRRSRVAGMAFCFPGYDAAGSDKPPPKICAAHWRLRLLAARPAFETTLLVGFMRKPGIWATGRGGT